MKKIGLMLAALFLLLIMLSACSNDAKEIIAEQDSTSEQTFIPAEDTGIEEEPAQEDAFIMPVEGKRPYAVMIDNEGSKPLPQGGIKKAQIVYEMIAEGGVTRLMPIFWNADGELIGPVRSSRHYFLDYVMEHDAIYVHFGWSPLAKSDISKLKINNINGVGKGGEAFWDLTKDKNNWQDSYTSAKNLDECVGRLKYPVSTDKKLIFSYNASDVEPGTGEKAEKIKIKYSGGYVCSYEYDSSSKKYSRFRQGKPHMERADNTQLTAKNIIIQYVANKRISGDREDRQELSNIGSGRGLFISCGKMMEITWSKKSRSSKTEYMDMEGKPVLLNPGQTWIQIVPKGNNAVIE
ncbi:DUF3048 family protein [Anaerobacterium chartisolvens]|uniref:DUF3048 family protein n=1 Tax=Anaerobacterium chartisolvens TaxID=1297424 RepID=A0A369BA47_9FIRM|nr:DUF3048 domain-containing protein [Anaerobacterium chartisolvens]RCX18409.1 DUF3048 family protein [Anaerobacterium chartisolvens]